MKILFLTKSKKFTNRLLRDLIEIGDEVTVVCKDYNSFSGTEMELFCKENRIKFLDNEDLYKALSENLLPQYDLAISNTYGKLIKKELISWTDGKIINLHGAILPDYKGAFTYNWGIYNLEKEWGATAHYVNESFDEGDIIEISRFGIDPSAITINQLEELTQEAAYYLSLKLIKAFRSGERPDAKKQNNDGRYYSRKDFEELKHISITDSEDVIKKKIHSCWCPPYEGAYIEIGGIRYFLMTKDMLETI